MGRAFVFAAVMGLMPEACARMLGQAPPPQGQTDPPPILPTAIATAPPTFAPPPDPNLPPLNSAPLPPGVSPDLAKARAAMDAKDYKRAKTLLFAKVKAGKSNREEAQILNDACGNLKDKPCLEMVHKTHPELEQ